ncbi:MAG: FAD-binding protein, partial [Chloroflexi bacterium]|nr:FAD-binding protein [Chloroflexota bacterium]
MDDGRQTTVSNCRRLSSVVRFPTMPTTISDLQSSVRDAARVRLHGSSTKSVADADALDLSGLRGIIDYQPNEFIVQAWAGTPVREVADLLAASGQYLPFDPLLVDAGATLGGTIAANASGPE